MQKPKAKTIIKYLLLAYLLHIFYRTPQTDWRNNKEIVLIENGGQKSVYSPEQTPYIKYVVAWWKKNIAKIGLSGILEKYILAPAGINLD